MASGFTWVRPPEGVAKAIEAYRERALAAVQAVAAYCGQEMQNAARSNAPWQDRTGNARSGLFFAVDGFGLSPIVGKVGSVKGGESGDKTVISGSKDRLILTLGHTMYYGKFLETSNGGRYAIVMSTIETNLPNLERMLRELFGR